MVMGTIRDNLLFGDKDATERDCREALERASAQFATRILYHCGFGL